MKFFLLSLAFLLFSSAALAEEASPEHEEKKPPAKPGDPVIQVLNLPIVMQWQKWEKDNKGGDISAWGESIGMVDDQKCWTVGLGESRADGMHVWRHFCVPIAGGDIWVEKISTNKDDETVYIPYDKWVTKCKPTIDSQGNC